MDVASYLASKLIAIVLALAALLFFYNSIQYFLDGFNIKNGCAVIGAVTIALVLCKRIINIWKYKRRA